MSSAAKPVVASTKTKPAVAKNKGSGAPGYIDPTKKGMLTGRSARPATLSHPLTTAQSTGANGNSLNLTRTISAGVNTASKTAHRMRYPNFTSYRRPGGGQANCVEDTFFIVHPEWRSEAKFKSGLVSNSENRNFLRNQSCDVSINSSGSAAAAGRLLNAAASSNSQMSDGGGAGRRRTGRRNCQSYSCCDNVNADPSQFATASTVGTNSTLNGATSQAVAGPTPHFSSNTSCFLAPPPPSNCIPKFSGGATMEDVRLGQRQTNRSGAAAVHRSISSEIL